MKSNQIEKFFINQLNNWPEVAERYNNLDNLYQRSFSVSNQTVKAVYNPLRRISVTATPSNKPTREESCPLCSNNRPAEQLALDFEGRYTILINPYPIFRRHFTIIANQHIPQQIDIRFRDMLDLAQQMESYTILYNGPGAGASIPHHAHFQAIEGGSLPIETYMRNVKDNSILRQDWLYPFFMIKATSSEEAENLFNRLFNALTPEQQQMNNLIAWYEGGTWYIAVVIRKAHRPDYYFRDDTLQLFISPATVEMGGVMVTIREEDYNKLNSDLFADIMKQVSISKEEADVIMTSFNSHYPDTVHIGILEAETIRFHLHTPYTINGMKAEGEQVVQFKNNKILYNNELYDTLTFTPFHRDDAWIEVFDVVIGKKFHWEQKQTLNFRGEWKIVVEGSQLVGINILPIEEYLKSVISSEMSADAPLESLKSHAIISRSWLINQIVSPKSSVTTDREGLVWYDSSGHTLYNVCADDHCQRYQGITQITNAAALQAIEATRGEVLLDEMGKIADARYSKCCGGIIEEYQYTWDDSPKTYAQAKRDWPDDNPLPDFNNETNAVHWINSSPESWCNVTDPVIIATTMKSYDQKTPDFYRWTVEYSAEQLADIIYNKTGIDPGKLLAIVPLSRGKSGRIYKLRIDGTLKSWVIGKELEIRRVLSNSHLYSSAFIVENKYNEDGVLTGFVFRGAGWGHGVGLCQIGAANMAANGYGYKEILRHYYPETQIKKVYD